MASLFLNQPPKLCLGKPAALVMRFSHFLGNGLSSQNPLISTTKIRMKGCRTYTIIDEINWYTSGGWLACFEHDGCISFTRPWSANDEHELPKVFWTPPFVALPGCQTQIVTSVAMSSSSYEDEDCVVAVKFLGPQLSFYRPAQRYSGWTNIRIKNPFLFNSTHDIFSKKDNKFLIPGSGGHLMGSWDRHTLQSRPKTHMLRFRNLPNLTKTQHQLLESCHSSVFLLESPTTHEIFMVKWYRKFCEHVARTKAIMVFKIEKGNAIYTQDIGELCMFLSDTDVVCKVYNLLRNKDTPNHVEFDDCTAFLSHNLASGPFISQSG